MGSAQQPLEAAYEARWAVEILAVTVVQWILLNSTTSVTAVKVRDVRAIKSPCTPDLEKDSL